MSIYIDSEIAPIGKFLSNGTPIRVPSFQRSYSWTDEEVKQLWVDIVEAIESKEEEYFLGPMVVKKEESHFEIIDGQQRITTIYIILSIIKRLFRQNGDEKRADWFRNKYFGEQDINSLDIEPKFHMNEENDIIFQKYVVTESSESQIRGEIKNKLKKDTNFLLLQAIIVIWDCILEWLESKTKNRFDTAILLDLHSFLQDKIQILVLKVKDDADAFVIFETLNDRGRSLNTIDLLKNHIFGKAGKSLDQAKSFWTSIRENLAEIDPSEKFLYQYWASIHGRTPKTKLFRLMRKEIEDPKTAISFLQNLNETSRLYAALNMSTHPYWDTHDQRTRENLDILKLLDSQQSIPILLAAAKNFSSDEFRKLTEILIVFAVRYNLIGELRTGVISNYFAEIPLKISKKEIAKAAKIANHLKPLYPKDEDFKIAFSNKVLKDSRKTRFLLVELEKQLNGGTSSVVNDTRSVNLEHILPKNPSSDWNYTLNTIDRDDRIDYVYRLGNLALVSTNSNKAAGAKGFEIKKNQIFCKETYIAFTKIICEYSFWDKNSIDDRQMKMANVAIATWKIEY